MAHFNKEWSTQLVVDASPVGLGAFLTQFEPKQEENTSGHQGIVKTKQLIRAKVWFPGKDSQIERMIQSCISCQANNHHYKPEPLRMTEMPTSSWQRLSLDFHGPMYNGKYLLVLIDEFSRYPIVKMINSVAGDTVIPELDEILSEHGIPELIKTDNGPPFNGQKFHEFSAYLGFKHKKITPYWPQANGEVERFMRT